MAYRTSLMLDWVLHIHDSGLYNYQINTVYTRVINIVNGFLIVLLLTIAAAWNFSFLVSTKKLKQVLVYFVMISVIINFTLPLVRLTVDVADAVQ